MKNHIENPVLYVIGSASGGVAPYRYRLTMYIDGVLTGDSGWMDQKWIYFPPAASDDYYLKAEVMDAVGSYASTDLVEGVKTEEQQQSVESDKDRALNAFKDLVGAAPSPYNLCGYLLDASTPESQWVTNVLIKGLQLDFTTLNNSGKKRAYLFREAFRASANGKYLELLSPSKLPAAIKLLPTGTKMAKDDLAESISEMCSYQIGSVITSVDSDRLYHIYEQYSSYSSEQFTSELTSLGYQSSSTDTIIDNLGIMKKLESFGDVVKAANYIVKGVNEGIDLYNQVQILAAMDPDCLNLIASSLRGLRDDVDMIFIANQLEAIANASTLEERVALLQCTLSEELAINTLADSLLKIGDYAMVYKLMYMGVDWAFGANALADNTYELHWACEGLTRLYNDFDAIREYYTNHYPENIFDDMLNIYISYLNLAASVEEEFVDIVESAENAPLGSLLYPPDQETKEAKAISERRAAELRELSDCARIIKQFWDMGSYQTMTNIIQECILKQDRYIVNLKYTDVLETYTGSGGGSGW